MISSWNLKGWMTSPQTCGKYLIGFEELECVWILKIRIWCTFREMFWIHYIKMRHRSQSRQNLSNPANATIKNHIRCPKIIWGYLGQFLSRMGEKSLLFYKLLKGNVTFEWTLDCEKAFDKLKEYLSQSPLLVSPKEGEKLLCIWL